MSLRERMFLYAVIEQELEERKNILERMKKQRRGG
jgi:hypothetical protein